MLIKFSAFTFSLLVASAALAQSGTAMTTEQLTQLTANEITLKLGGEGMGYAGSLKLSNNGKGEGSVNVNAGGGKHSISGTWKIEDGKFCRIWKDVNKGQQVCETWYLTAERAVEVYNGKQKIGVNSW